MTHHLQPATLGLEWRDLLDSATSRVGSRLCAQYFGDHGVSPLPLAGYPVLEWIPDDLAIAAADAVRNAKPAPTVGTDELREAIAERSSATSVVPVHASEIVVSNGAMAALQGIWLALARQGGNVVVPTPTYFARGAIEIAGLSFRPVEALGPDGAWDWAAVERRVDSATVALFLVNPNNPTGDLLSEADYAAIAAISARHRDLWIVFDESYDRFVYPPHEFRPALQHQVPHTAVVGSFSKAFGLPWLRVGYVIAPPDLTRPLRRILEWAQLYGSHVNQRIALAAIRADPAWLRDLASGFRRNRDRMIELLRQELDAPPRSPSAGPFLYVPVGGDQPLTITDVLPLWDQGLEAIPAVAFGSSAAAVRIPFGGMESALGIAVGMLSEWLRGRAIHST